MTLWCHSRGYICCCAGDDVWYLQWESPPLWCRQSFFSLETQELILLIVLGVAVNKAVNYIQSTSWHFTTVLGYLCRHVQLP